MNFLLAMMLMLEVPAGTGGKWEGEARPVNDFLAGQRIVVAMEIGADGGVMGKVGGARMVEGRFRPRAKHEWKAMNHYEYRVDCRLEGEVAPGVKRRGARVLLNWREGRWEGWVVTEGTVFGGKKSVQVQAVDLVMQRRD
jgi:hypothetical protein